MELDAQMEAKIMALISDAVPRKLQQGALTRETHLQKELGMDSIAILSMVFRFEEVFQLDLTRINLQISMSELQTVNDLLQMSKSILEQAAALSNTGNG